MGGQGVDAVRDMCRSRIEVSLVGWKVRGVDGERVDQFLCLRRYHYRKSF